MKWPQVASPTFFRWSNNQWHSGNTDICIYSLPSVNNWMRYVRSLLLISSGIFHWRFDTAIDSLYWLKIFINTVMPHWSVLPKTHGGVTIKFSIPGDETAVGTETNAGCSRLRLIPGGALVRQLGWPVWPSRSAGFSVHGGVDWEAQALPNAFFYIFFWGLFSAVNYRFIFICCRDMKLP